MSPLPAYRGGISDVLNRYDHAYLNYGERDRNLIDNAYLSTAACLCVWLAFII
jgi:hypothetical protein